MRYLLLLLLSFTLIRCSSGPKPTKEDIIKVMKETWEQEASSLNPKVTVDVTNIDLGASSEANESQELSGIPKGALVTTAQIDWTENTFYDSGVRQLKRITTAWVYKDQFGKWAVMNTATTYPDK